jgi:type IV pilus assembly protein PilO
MRRDFTTRKRAILGAVILLVIADLALGAYSWQLSSAPQAPKEQLAAQTKQHALLKKSIDDAQRTRDNVPAIQKDCEHFEQSLFPASSGYSAVKSEIDSMARKSGIRLDERSFKESEIASRGMKEVAMDATVSGDYRNVVAFLNALQRSPNLYTVDSLTAGTENTNQVSTNIIRVTLHLKTYFRNAS